MEPFLFYACFRILVFFRRSNRCDDCRMSVFFSDEIRVALELYCGPSQKSGETINIRQKFKQIRQSVDFELRRDEMCGEMAALARHLCPNIVRRYNSAILLRGPTVMIVERECKELDGEDHLRASEVKSIAIPIRVCSADVMLKI